MVGAAHSTGHVEKIPLAPDPETPAGAAAAAGTFAFAGRGELVRCKKCRRKIAFDNNFLEHEPGSGQVAFRWHKRETAMTSPLTAAKEVATKLGLQCTSIFVEPIGWMSDLIADGLHEGNLNCPKCSARLGKYHWHGAQCSCGSWITPAFQLNRAKCDVMPVRDPAIYNVGGAGGVVVGAAQSAGSASAGATGAAGGGAGVDAGAAAAGSVSNIDLALARPVASRPVVRRPVASRPVASRPVVKTNNPP